MSNLQRCVPVALLKDGRMKRDFILCLFITSFRAKMCCCHRSEVFLVHVFLINIINLISLFFCASFFIRSLLCYAVELNYFAQTSIEQYLIMPFIKYAVLFLLSFQFLLAWYGLQSAKVWICPAILRRLLLKILSNFYYGSRIQQGFHSTGK